MCDSYLGEIRMFGGTYAPRDWAFCIGTLLSVNDNQALYSLIGNTFGGTGPTNFALPDLRGRLPVHQGAGPGLRPRTRGQRFGSETVILHPNELPVHNHPMQASINTADSSSPAGKTLAAAPTGEEVYVENTDPTKLLPFANQAVSLAGNNLPHANLMPALCINFIISLQGEYPTRD